MNIWFIVIAVMVLSFIIQQTLQSKFRKYSEIPTPGGMTGAEVARRMLEENGIKDVRITCIEGQLTDHFNPETMTVNLSESGTSCSTRRAMPRSRCAPPSCRWSPSPTVLYNGLSSWEYS